VASRAVAIAYAREGADVLISNLSEDEDAAESKKWVEQAGRKAVLIRGDVQNPSHCRAIIDKALSTLGSIDILVNNAAHQASFKSIDDISDEEWERTFRINIHAMFYLSKAAVKHMQPGSVIINTASINSDQPNPILLAYATTKGAIYNFTGDLAQLLANKEIRVNAVAPGTIWTPLIPSTLPEESVATFGKQTPLKRPGQPAELATAYVMLAAVQLRLGGNHRRHRREAVPLSTTLSEFSNTAHPSAAVWASAVFKADRTTERCRSRSEMGHKTGIALRVVDRLLRKRRHCLKAHAGTPPASPWALPSCHLE